MATPTLDVRRVRFEYPDDFDPCWHRTLPEFACGANAVSLMMPHVEPYVARTVRDVTGDLDDPELAAEASAWVGQETQHHRQHRWFNELLIAAHPGLRHIDRWMGRTYRWLERRGPRFGLAYAAGAETVAYASARWVEAHRTELLTGADPTAASLFLWHLAEEVEHKSVAHDVWAAVDGDRRRYALGVFVSMIVLAWFTVLGTVALLIGQGRWWNPLAHIRLFRWTMGLTFTLLPDAFATLRKDHHPSDFVDPTWYRTWLDEYDASDGTMPLWERSLRY